jgi:hypothetical protein
MHREQAGLLWASAHILFQLLADIKPALFLVTLLQRI